MKVVEMIGKTFGRLKVYARYGSDRRGQAVWWCICDCGRRITALGINLRGRNTRSCGCLQVDITRKNSTTHGCSNRNRTSEYTSWSKMIARCESKSYHAYNRYGSRGIKVCARWRRSFTAFLIDMGIKPSPSHSLDRINNDGNYEPKNCRWATKKEQRANRSDSITFKRVKS